VYKPLRGIVVLVTTVALAARQHRTLNSVMEDALRASASTITLRCLTGWIPTYQLKTGGSRADVRRECAGHAFRPDAERHEEFCIRRSSIRQAA
jgi:hypothetical protein